MAQAAARPDPQRLIAYLAGAGKTVHERDMTLLPILDFRRGRLYFLSRDWPFCQWQTSDSLRTNMLSSSCAAGRCSSARPFPSDVRRFAHARSESVDVG